MNTCCGGRSTRPARLFSLGLLDVPPGVRLRRPPLREATAGFGLDRLATVSLNIPGLAFHRLHRGGDDDLLQYGREHRRHAAALSAVLPVSFPTHPFLTPCPLVV